jgi:signal transduction histidine kinase
MTSQAPSPTLGIVAGDRRSHTASEQVERVAARGFVAGRAGQIAFSGLMFAVDRKKYSKPKLQTALFFGTVLESAWLSRKILRAGTYQQSGARRLDTAWAALGMVLCEAWLGDQDAAPWMKNVAIGSATGAAICENPAERAGLLGLLSAAAVVSGLRAKGRDSNVAGLALAVNDVVSWTGQHLAISTYLSAYRRQARLKDESDRKALHDTAELTANEERTRQHSLVHRRTAGVLRSIAKTDDMALASAAARQEASRLRQLLRSKGEVPKDLEAALYEAAELARGNGLKVELVTAELARDSSPEVAASMWEAVHGTLQAAKDCANSGRVVIRAVSDAESVTVTIRHRFTEILDAALALYVGRLDELKSTLDSVGGNLEVWSAEGRGVRVTCVVPAGATSRGHSRLDQPAERVPDARTRRGSAGDDHGALDEGDLEIGFLAKVLGGSHHDIGGSVVRNGDARPGGEALEATMQQGPGGDDPGGRNDMGAAGNASSKGSHQLRMTETRSGVLVGNIHFRARSADEDTSQEELRVHKALSTIFFTWRFAGLATGLSALVAGRRSYRSEIAACTQLLAAMAESTWLARRVRDADYQLDPLARGVDVATAVTMLVMGRANLVREHRRTWLNWAPWSFAAATVCLCSSDMESQRRAELGAVTVIGSTAVVADRWVDGIVNASGMTALFVVGRHFVRLFFRGTQEIAWSRAEALQEGRRLAVEQERFRQLRLLHDSALQTLEAVGSGRFSELATVQETAIEEARKLEAEIAGEAESAGTLAQEIADVVSRQEARGLDIAVRIDGSAAVAPLVLGALRDACNESLTNVRKHARTTRASVTVEVVGDGVRLTVEDHGVGFDPSEGNGFGLPQSIKKRMTDVGGTAEIFSSRGHGTRVVLRGPA